MFQSPIMYREEYWIPKFQAIKVGHEMEDKVREEELRSLIRAESEVNALLAQEAQAMLIPYMGSRENFYLLVSLILSANCRAFNSVSFVVRHVATLAVTVASKLPGLEVAIYAPMNGKLRRVLWLAITKEGYEYVSKLTDNDLLLEPVYPGIKCIWDVEKPQSSTGSIVA